MLRRTRHPAPAGPSDHRTFLHRCRGELPSRRAAKGPGARSFSAEAGRADQGCRTEQQRCRPFRLRLFEYPSRPETTALANSNLDVPPGGTIKLR